MTSFISLLTTDLQRKSEKHNDLILRKQLYKRIDGWMTGHMDA